MESLLAQEPLLPQFLESPACVAPNVSPDTGESDRTEPPVDATGLVAGRYRILRRLATRPRYFALVATTMARPRTTPSRSPVMSPCSFP